MSTDDAVTVGVIVAVIAVMIVIAVRARRRRRIAARDALRRYEAHFPPTPPRYR